MTQRELAEYIALKRDAHYHFTTKTNQEKLLKEVASFFENVSWAPDHTTKDKPNHGRNESRRSWVTTELNACLKFPHVAQAFKFDRVTYRKKREKIHELSHTVSPVKLPTWQPPNRS